MNVQNWCAPQVARQQWPNLIFCARAQQTSGVVRRKARCVDRVVGRRRLEWAADRRGFHVIEVCGPFPSPRHRGGLTGICLAEKLVVF